MAILIFNWFSFRLAFPKKRIRQPCAERSRSMADRVFFEDPRILTKIIDF